LRDKTKYSLGICVGGSTVSFVVTSINDGRKEIIQADSFAHEGNPKKIIERKLFEYYKEGFSVVVTGRKFKKLINAQSISEPEAVEETLRFVGLVNENFVLVSLGGENFVAYKVKAGGSIESVIAGNKCASGTGEFFLQQIGRMGIPLNEIEKIEKTSNYYSVSGRCSVFCKSDCTHALNKGIPKGQVITGLSKMIADKAIELIEKQTYKRVYLIGGVTKNSRVVNFIKEKYPDTNIADYPLCFEALGASLYGLQSYFGFEPLNLFGSSKHSFPVMESIRKGIPKVTFKKIQTGIAADNEEFIVGLDVGSTTTKAVLMRVSDNAIVASVYLRTNGNPIKAAVECYRNLKSQVNASIKIIGLGTTGSGRHIAALHALTRGVVNEIIAHAVAAAYFDPEVDTIFEIGGQDAKYTYLTNGIASDYAMNEACSAGTGSFLEEAAKESLSIDYRDIERIALESDAPLNFNDQCAAFISSDIKTASHEGAEVKDIVAGLVYSICLNYVNRVKGNRPVGKKVFMQGGVCYNKAVPYSMALLTGKDIIVPPEPGLMGAFGVALEIKNRITLSLLNKGNFSFDVLINRKFNYTTEFICAGGAEKCDRKCSIALIEVDGKKYPFGGACSKYYNQRYNIHIKPAENNLVKLRQELVFKKYLLATLNIDNEDSIQRIGISKSFLVNTLFPLYYNFFTKLGFEVVLSDEKNIHTSQKVQSSFCYPMELAHSSFEDLLKKKVDYIFLPHITQMDSHSENQYNRLCVFVQGECYNIKSTFRQEILEKFHITEAELDKKVISPVIDFTSDYQELESVFVKTARLLGKSSSQGKDAFRFAYDIQNRMYKEFQDIGYEFLKQLENQPDKFAMVLFGRSYNAFATEANLNIPHKFASKDVTIIPHDFLPREIRTSYENMYWYSGNQILSSARFVKNHKQLYGVYITNYSCGPDSFIITYFRRIMGDKPSLTLELDSHSADVGIETRIDAAIDIIKNYRELKRTEYNDLVTNNYEKKPLQVITENGELFVIDNDQKKSHIKSSDVEILIPSMGHFSSDAFSAVFRSLGVKCFPLPIPTFETVKQGRSYASCKECLPFILTTGSLLEFIEEHYSPEKKILFFMPHGYGPCRQGQYHIMIKDIIKDLGAENIGVLTMDDENAFADFGQDFFIKQWTALLIADVYHDIEATVSTIAIDKENSLKLLDEQWSKIIKALESGDQNFLYKEIEKVATTLRQIKLTVPLSEAKIISLIGEIYVRREEFSRSELMKALLERSFVVKTAPITEYVYYSNYLLINGIVSKPSLIDKTLLKIKDTYQRIIERKIKKIFAKSGLYKFEMVDLDKTMTYAKKLVSDKLIGEGILTVGLAMREILEESCGVVSIGPFNCIPSRLSEAILKKEMNLIGKYRTMGIDRDGFPEEITDLPFLYVESDGNAFPQITQSKIEIFMLQAEKLHNSLKRIPRRAHHLSSEL